jgi:NAD(P)-dependent dehydrogenase (short-subunit alcohol dehydrogenase family)
VAELNARRSGSAHYIVANLTVSSVIRVSISRLIQGTRSLISVQDKAGVDALISALSVLEPANKLHILVNNSGVSWGSPFNAVPEDKGWDNVMAVNVKSLFYRELSNIITRSKPPLIHIIQ